MAGRIRGSRTGGQREEGIADASHTAQIAPLLVEPRWGRRGHGSRLLAAAVDHARADGFTRLITWVPVWRRCLPVVLPVRRLGHRWLRPGSRYRGR